MAAAIPPRHRPVRARAAGPSGTPVVVGVDIGTTSAKALAVDPSLAVWAGAANAYPLRSPHRGWAEQDPDEVAAAAVAALRDVADAAREHGAQVRAVSLGAAMHSVLAVDDRRRPLTAALTYADGRAAQLARALRDTDRGRALYHRTGVPHHAMVPLHKVRWFTEHEPAVARAAAAWVSLKEHVLSRLGADVVADESVASGSGWFDLRRRRWDDDALDLTGISEPQLSPVVPTTTIVEAARLDVPVVVGGGDGALANLGAGALAQGVAAVSIGTSGAVRVGAREVRTDAAQRLFCAALAAQRWVVGGAVSNGGVVLRWLRDSLFAAQHATYEDLTALAEPLPPGADGLVFVPHLVTERAFPSQADGGGVLRGLALAHGPGHIVRAAMEGVALQLRWVVDAMADNGCDVEEVRATGGFTASPLWVQILADVLNRPVTLAAELEGSSVGAALLGMVALDLVDGIDSAAALVTPTGRVDPRTSAAAAYDDVYSTFLDALETGR